MGEVDHGTAVNGDVGRGQIARTRPGELFEVVRHHFPGQLRLTVPKPHPPIAA
jgi:hypothetical protein